MDGNRHALSVVATYNEETGLYSALETNAYTQLTTDWQGADMVYTVSGAVPLEVFVDLRTSSLMEYDLLLESSDNVGNGLDSLVVKLTIAVENRAGDLLADEDNGQVVLVSGLNLGDDDDFAYYSLSTHLLGLETTQIFKNCGHILITVINDAATEGDTGTLSLTVGIR